MNTLICRKAYTISRNGRLNVWECDTKLDGLIKRDKYEIESIEESKNEELFAGKTKETDDLDKVMARNDEDQDSVKKIYIRYSKKAK